jgi:hypothetical protein
MARITYQTKGTSKVRNIATAVGMLALSGFMAFGIAVGGTSPGASHASKLNASISAELQEAANADAAVSAVETSKADGNIGETSGAHFMSATDSVNSAGALVVKFDEAGLGNGNINYTLTADSVANYGCVNNGGNHPRATNKETMAASLSTGGTFQSRNGRVQASLTIGPISAGAFSCPAGQTLVLADVSYTNVTLTDTTNNVTAALADVTRTFYLFR